MITGASHSLHTNLTESLSLYRQQLDKQKSDQVSSPQNGEISTLPAPVEPTQPKSYEVVVELNQIPLSEQLKETAEERRDMAREAAMLVESMQHKEDLVNAYINAASDSNDATTNSDNKVSPGEVYQETLNYLRRQDLADALQQAANGDQLGKIIDITV
jgi:hypothetical protein